MNKYISLTIKIIITFWMYAYCLLDTPEYRMRMEARRLTEAIKLYIDGKNNDLKTNHVSMTTETPPLSLNFNFNRL